MLILVDSAMPYWQDFFKTIGEVVTFSVGELEKDDFAHADSLALVDVLLVRSTTKVDSALINKMPKLKLVGTATAGYDHIDSTALNKKQIRWTAAGGCNAQAVAQYVTSALLNLAHTDNFLLRQKRIAIVGAGNVGGRVQAILKAIGCEVLIYDPPREYAQIRSLARANDSTQFASLDEVLNADIISVHAPLNSDAEFPSLHTFNLDNLSQLGPHQYLINAGRGELIDNKALLQGFLSRPEQMPQLVLDVWEDEPHIETRLLPFLRYASQHIAGHTLEGKANGTSMLYDFVCSEYNLPATVKLTPLLPVFDLQLPDELQARLHNPDIKDAKAVQNCVMQVVNCVYDIKNDDSVFRARMAQSKHVAVDFTQSRQQYPIRREFSALSISCTNTNIKEFLCAIGFSIANGRTTPL